MRLGRKGWNNVIIFSMLIMIFFLNGWHKNLAGNNNEPSFQVILPAQSFILTLSFVNQKVERIGTGWRTAPLPADSPLAWQANEEQLSALIRAWQSTELMNNNGSLARDLKEPLSVATFELAGEGMPWMYLLYKDNDDYYLLEKNTQRILLLNLNQAKQLFPSLVFLEGSPNNA